MAEGPAWEFGCLALELPSHRVFAPLGKSQRNLVLQEPAPWLLTLLLEAACAPWGWQPLMRKACWAPVLGSHVLFGFCHFRGRCYSLFYSSSPPTEGSGTCHSSRTARCSSSTSSLPTVSETQGNCGPGNCKSRVAAALGISSFLHLLSLSFLHPLPRSSPIPSCPPHPPISPHSSLPPLLLQESL